MEGVVAGVSFYSVECVFVYTFLTLDPEVNPRFVPVYFGQLSYLCTEVLVRERGFKDLLRLFAKS